MSSLENVKVGDTVLWGRGYNGDNTKIVKVARLTATQIVISNGGGSELRFRKSDGGEVGRDSWSKSHLKVVSEKEIQDLRNQREHKRKVAALESHKWRDEKPELIATIYALLVGASAAAEREKEQGK